MQQRPVGTWESRVCSQGSKRLVLSRSALLLLQAAAAIMHTSGLPTHPATQPLNQPIHKAPTLHTIPTCAPSGSSGTPSPPPPAHPA